MNTMNTAINTRNASLAPTRKSMAFLLWTSFALLALGFAPGALHAGQITYTLDFYGDGFAGQGTITTDGNTGLLAESDIVSWGWEWGNGADTYSVTASPSNIFSFQGLYATATDLYLPGGEDNSLRLGNGLPTSNSHWQDAVWQTWGSGRPQSYFAYNDVYETEYEPYQGQDASLEVASAGQQSVPEPSTLVLGLLGLAGSGAVGLWKGFRRA
jgi:hypothetical protein